MSSKSRVAWETFSELEMNSFLSLHVVLLFK